MKWCEIREAGIIGIGIRWVTLSTSRPFLNPWQDYKRSWVSWVQVYPGECIFMDTKRGGSFMTEQVLNIVWRRREVQNATVFCIGEVDADLTKSLSSFYEVEKARSRYWEWGVNKKWRRRRTLVISLVLPMVLLGQTGEKSVVSRGHTLKGGVFKKIRQWRDSTITILWKKKACMEKIAWGIGRDLRTNVQRWQEGMWAMAQEKDCPLTGWRTSQFWGRMWFVNVYDGDLES